MTPGLPDPVHSRVVLIGVGSYADAGLNPLPAVRNNVADLAAVLTDPALWGLRSEHCDQLLDVDEPCVAARHLHRAAQQAEDTVMVYFAGHGIVDADSGELVLAMGTTARDIARHTGLTYEWVREIVGRCRAMRRIVILDCCFSGRAVGVMADPASVILGQVDIEGTFVLTATPANSPAKAPEGSEHTAFTGGLLETLRTGIPGASEFITLDDIYKHTRQAMVRGGWPRPQKCDTNGIGELALIRNRWHDLTALVPQRRRRRLAGSDVTVGVRLAVAAVAPTLGPGGPDSVTALDEATQKCDQRHRAGFGVVREVMEGMRQDYGDGAATAAVIAGELIAGISGAVEAGADADTLVAEIEQESARAARELTLLARTDRGGDAVAAAVSTALGQPEAAALVVAAVRRVGANNVEISCVEGGELRLDFAGRLSVPTVVMAPNTATSAIPLVDPYVVVCPDGRLAIPDLLAAARTSPAPLLVFTPQVSLMTLRQLLHVFADSVVAVRPAQGDFDWDALRGRVGGGRPWKAHHALITPSSTTIVGLPESRNPEDGRIRVHVGGTDSRVSTATRSLAIARAVTSSGVLPGGQAALFHASNLIRRASAPLSGSKRAHDGADVLDRALMEPMRQLVRNAGRDADAICGVLAREPDTSLGFESFSGLIADMPEAGILDPLATVRGAVENAVAAVAHYLAVV